MRGIGGADDRWPAAAKKQSHDALRLDPRDLAELLLEVAGPLQDGRRPGIRRLQHDERLFAFRKHLLELIRSLRRGVAGDDEPIDGRIRRDAGGAINARHCEDYKDPHDHVAHAQYASKDFQEPGRDVHNRE